MYSIESSEWFGPDGITVILIAEAYIIKSYTCTSNAFVTVHTSAECIHITLRHNKYFIRAMNILLYLSTTLDRSEALISPMVYVPSTSRSIAAQKTVTETMVAIKVSNPIL